MYDVLLCTATVATHTLAGPTPLPSRQLQVGLQQMQVGLQQMQVAGRYEAGMCQADTSLPLVYRPTRRCVDGLAGVQSSKFKRGGKEMGEDRRPGHGKSPKSTGERDGGQVCLVGGLNFEL